MPSVREGVASCRGCLFLPLRDFFFRCLFLAVLRERFFRLWRGFFHGSQEVFLREVFFGGEWFVFLLERVAECREF